MLLAIFFAEIGQETYQTSCTSAKKIAKSMEWLKKHIRENNLHKTIAKIRNGSRHITESSKMAVSPFLGLEMDQ